jgi:tRNA A-37 threonylcarbamoyl transferase component Bud32
VIAVRCFFRREVETNEQLHRGLAFAQLEGLGQAQAAGFQALEQLLAQDRRKLEGLLDEVMAAVEEARAAAVQGRDAALATHGAVLDIQVELERLGGLHLANANEIRSVLVQAQQLLALVGMQRDEVKPQHSLSIRGEDERRVVKALLARFRGLPPEEQRRVPALLNGLGKLQLGSGEFEEAGRTFAEVVATVPDPAAKAEASFNAYRAAVEERRWDAALNAIRQATALDAARFSPFPWHRYEPRRILGAGGFGTAVLCHDRHFDEEVVIKTLHAADLERGLDDVFREARTLRRLSHPAIIGVRDCEYADPAAKARPYLVMDYFAGGTLEEHVATHGPLEVGDLIEVATQVARGMQAAHGQGVLHRDLKPANVLVRKEGGRWQVKVIDFGLALRKSTVETSMAVCSAGHTVLSDSVAGTVQYAPPEQLGRLPGVKVGPHSDVYAFGKTCCHALFRTTEPKSRHWASLPEEFAEVLERCTEQELEYRCPDFGPVLAVLKSPGRSEEAVRRRADGEEESGQERGGKELTLKVLERNGLLPEGTEIEVMPDARPGDPPPHDPNVFRARIGKLGTRKSVVWAKDGNAYALTELSCKLEEYGLSWVRPKTFELWRIVGQTESMWYLADRLRSAVSEPASTLPSAGAPLDSAEGGTPALSSVAASELACQQPIELTVSGTGGRGDKGCSAPKQGDESPVTIITRFVAALTGRLRASLGGGWQVVDEVEGGKVWSELDWEVIWVAKESWHRIEPLLRVALAYHAGLPGEVYFTVRHGEDADDTPTHPDLGMPLAQALKKKYGKGRGGVWWPRWWVWAKKDYRDWSDPRVLLELGKTEAENQALPYFSGHLAGMAKVVESVLDEWRTGHSADGG